MKILGVKINWMHGYMNHPEVTLVVDKAPSFPNDEPIWVWEPNGMLWCEKEGVVSYLFHPGEDANPKTTNLGFGGARFTRKLLDGSTITSNNCWSSRASCLPFPAVDVTVEEAESRSRRHFAVSVALLEQALGEYKVDAHVIGHRPYKNNEVVYVVSSKATEVAKPCEQ